MGFKQHISRTWQMIEQQVNDVPFRPDDEEFGQIKPIKSRACGLLEKPKLYICCRVLCRDVKIA